MKKKTLALILAALMLVSLTACSASSSTTSSFSTTVNGETKTTTTTTTVGTDGYSKETVTTTESEADAESEFDRNAAWHETFFEGAEGQGEDGSLYYFAVDDFSDMNEAAFMMISAGEAPDIYIVGHFQDSDDGLLLVDDYDEDGHYIRFWVTDTSVEDGFELEFTDGERIAFTYVDQDTIIDDMLAYVS